MMTVKTNGDQRTNAVYFFYFDESGSRDPSVGTESAPKDHLFTRSELSNGVQLADLLAYSVYRAFRDENFDYIYFDRLLASFYRRRTGTMLDGLKVWPEGSPLIEKARAAWGAYRTKTLRDGRVSDVGLGLPISSPKGHPTQK